MKKNVIAVMTRGAMPTRHLVVAALVQSRNLVSVELKWNLSVLEPSHFDGLLRLSSKNDIVPWEGPEYQ
jgi:hypothetical protein